MHFKGLNIVGKILSQLFKFLVSTMYDMRKFHATYVWYE